jgi:vacuolar-type H+-ATPase subunit F/Vma7
MGSMEIYLLGDELTATGFRLAGVKSYVLSERNREEVFNELKDKKAILVITQSASQMLGERVEKLKAKSLVLVIPEKQGEEYLPVKNIIRDTIGFDLKA